MQYLVLLVVGIVFVCELFAFVRWLLLFCLLWCFYLFATDLGLRVVAWLVVWDLFYFVIFFGVG